MPATLALLVWFLTTPAQTLERGVALAQDHQHDASEAVLGKLAPGRSGDPARYHFYRCVNAFRLNQRGRVLQQAGYLEHLFTPVPDRYQVLAMLMRAEAELWKQDDDDLGDISREMLRARDRLHAAQAGPATRQLQQEIVDRLDRLIKSKEDQANAKTKADADERDAAARGQQPGTGPQQPLPDSQIVDGGGTGRVDTRRLRSWSERWGALDPRQRARAVQELTRGLSARHREAVENYFRLLSERPTRRP